jgi:hypothetical protein
MRIYLISILKIALFACFLGCQWEPSQPIELEFQPLGFFERMEYSEYQDDMDSNKVVNLMRMSIKNNNYDSLFY